ncbi:SMC-Scp complex subunit ScpB [Chelatococcus asaccharovorans]|uniref:Condensin subunit ScpB n=1 Tax=Chelatococcus asaccharovorans TaxID=28210 RepID=A0A2V3U580_9HYPH|nr:SMC-Scp complex subunit ScpB [Chelatococcus asaccharovorans]MBS7703956.1 SMC-Scp complex subunit ScpB [Chelatococcus asaccharovorans]PXW58121.1 condensin subunit ScpB [Chelatococcus asaccharovorans]
MTAEIEAIRGDDEEAFLFAQALRAAEAVLFASREPVSEQALAGRLPPSTDVPAVLARLQAAYSGRGVNLVRVAGLWVFRTAPDLAASLAREVEEPRKLSRAALETLAIIAYHQPVTRAEIEDIRGVATSRGTLDTLLESSWIRLRGRRRTPGRPVTYGTTAAFLAHFGLDAIDDLPGLDELKGAGFIDGRVPSAFSVPLPSDSPALTGDEDPLEDGPLEDNLFERLGEEVGERFGEGGEPDEDAP